MILVDAHVHIYDCFDLQNFLDSALNNFKTVAVHYGHLDEFTALLLLAETPREDWFERLTDYADREHTEGYWAFRRTSETCSIWAQRDGGEGLFLVAGRQIVTSENLEVLALATEMKFRNGLFLKDIILEVRDSGAIPVIPWGVGKWTGRRGAILTDTMKTEENSRFFLGDNGGRPFFWPQPSHLKEAEANRLHILPGTDPLPFPSEASRPGSFGFTLKATIDDQKPASDLKSILLSSRISVQPFGKLERPYRFFKNQFRMQVRKILRTS